MANKQPDRVWLKNNPPENHAYILTN